MIDIDSLSSNLTLHEDGVWYSKGSETISYPSEGNEDCYQLEDDSFWFKHRNECIKSAVSRFPSEDNGPIFDIGGGNGFVSLALKQSGFEVALVEPGKFGALRAKARGIDDVICATIGTAQFEANSISSVGLFDVIEHIEDDLAFLQATRRIMKQGGRLYATVPSYQLLWSAEDVSAGHFRRYDLKSICHALASAGFEIEFSSYIFRPLPFPIFFLRSLPYRLHFSRDKIERRHRNEHKPKQGLVGTALNAMLKREVTNICSGQSMRFGGSCLIVGKAH